MLFKNDRGVFLKGVRNGPLKAEIGGFKKWDILNLLLFIAFERLCAELDKRLILCKKVGQNKFNEKVSFGKNRKLK